MHRDDDDMELAVRPMLGRIMRSMGGLAYTVYTTPLYLIRSTTALGLDVLLGCRDSEVSREMLRLLCDEQGALHAANPNAKAEPSPCPNPNLTLTLT